MRTDEGHEVVMATNYFGSFLLTNLLLGKSYLSSKGRRSWVIFLPETFLKHKLISDLLKASSPSRILHVSSMLHNWATMNLENLDIEKDQNWPTTYMQSKSCQVLFSRELSHRLKGTGHKLLSHVNSQQPSIIFICKPLLLVMSEAEYCLLCVFKKE